MHATASTTPEPLRRPNVVLTPRGHAVVALNRFADTLRDLSPKERAEVLGLFSAALHEHYATGRVG